MRKLFSRLDQRVAIGGGVLLASAALLVGGLISIFAALGDNNVDLPSEGTLQEILAESGGGAGPASDVDDAGPPPPLPVRLLVPRLYLDAPVAVFGLDAQRYPQVPDRGDLVAWYDFSARPGHGSNAVFSGHVDWQTRSGDPIPGVFYRLRELEVGDTINVVLEDGTQLQYRVTGNVAAEYNDPNLIEVMGPTQKDVITLITCGGTWFRDASRPYGGNYTHRVVVRAERVFGLADQETPAPGAHVNPQG